ncbi:unnamed protein product, partial [Rotaria magnacalcarata]
MLRTNKTIEILRLHSNQITTNGAQSIAKALARNTVLKELDLSNNKIRDKGVEA